MNLPFLRVATSQKILSGKSSAFGKSNRNELIFTGNKGQISDQYLKPRPDVLFTCQYGKFACQLKKDGISYQFYKVKDDEIQVYRLDMEWMDINPTVVVRRGRVMPAYDNYYLAACPNGATKVYSYRAISYENIYEGIELKWYANGSALEYDFYMEPHSDIGRIRWKVRGAEEIFINALGQLVIRTPQGSVLLEAPKAKQNGRSVNIKWSLNVDLLSFDVGYYNPEFPMTIDPVVRQRGTYYGGSGSDTGWSCAADAAANVYLAGSTRSLSAIATSGSHQNTIAGSIDAFITKFDPQGIRLWSTYYGGKGVDIARSCAVDDSLNPYIAGQTTSDSAIASAGSHQDSTGGSSDAFLVKFDKNGIRLWASYYGGSGSDYGYDCVVDRALNVYLSGTTASNTGIATSGSHQSGNSGATDAFIAKFSSNGIRLWASYYGGSLPETGRGLAVDDSNNVFLTGNTRSITNIATSGAHYSTKSGTDEDAFLVKFNPNGTRLWATYYGGIALDLGYRCATDKLYNVFLCGTTGSTSAISSNGCHQLLNGGGYDAFLVKFNNLGSRQWATYFGGSSSDDGYSCIVDDSLNVYLSGRTASQSAIATSNGYQVTPQAYNNGFLVKFDINGVRRWGTYYGDIDKDEAFDCAIDPFYHVYLAGYTAPGYLFADSGSHQSNFGGGSSDAYLAKFSNCTVNNALLIDTACLTFTSPSGKYIYGLSGTYFDTLLNTGGCDSIISVNITINKVDTSVFRAGNILTANAVSATYQWVDCTLGYLIIPGATKRSFSPSNKGSYAVIIGQNGCMDTSNCISVNPDGIIANEFGPGFMYGPNPTSGAFRIDLGRPYVDVTTNIRASDGRHIMSHYFPWTDKIEEEIHDPDGIYLVELISGEGKSAVFILTKYSP